jgi:ankyrin repeat protein
MNKLFKCIEQNNIKELRKLLDNKFVTDNINKEYAVIYYFGYYTPLKFATEKGYTKCVKALLQAGANPNLQRGEGWTVLMTASEGGYKEIVKLLLQAGATPDLKNSCGYTALMYASIEGHTECVQLLLQAGAKTDIQNIIGSTALMLASYWDQTENVRLLLKYGANPLLKNKDKTAYDLAENETIKKLLKNSMKAYPVMSLLGPTFKKKSGLPAKDIGRKLITEYLFSKKSNKNQYTSVLKSNKKSKSKKSKKRLNKI